ncbi:PREDICTED: DNA-directed RNA polymerase I subunit RPA49-like isoform X2 [Priapulus caudatus]|nr:PREDICTED: DNA-directed RNA polymerase I subunit RPA49-like isoform X2 [Priapulus caudatus]
MCETESICQVELMSSCSPILLASFSNGKLRYDKSGICKKPPAFGYFKSTSQEKGVKRKRQLVAETDRTQYIGINESDGAYKELELSRCYVGVVDTKTRKMQVYEADNFKMNPYFLEKRDDEEVEEKKKESYQELKDNLIAEFGSKKSKRVMEARHRNKVGAEVLEKSITNAVEDVLAGGGGILHDAQHVGGASDALPPCNKEATKPQDVYQLSDILTETDLDSLRSRMLEFKNASSQQIAEWRKSESYSGFILTHLEKLPLVEKPREERAGLLVYMHWLTSLHNLKAADVKKRTIPLPPGIPKLIMTRLINTFTITGTTDGTNSRSIRGMPARLKDKLALQIIVLALHISGFILDLADIAKVLKIGQKRILGYVQALGCKVVTSKAVGSTGSKSASLELPLVFPTKNFKRGKRS